MGHPQFQKKTEWMQLQDHMLRLIALCMWHFQHAVWVMDHAGIILTDEEAQEGFRVWAANPIIYIYTPEIKLGHCQEPAVKLIKTDDCMVLSLQEISASCELHLIAWQHLACECQKRSMRLFKLRPKHHSLDHMSSQLARTKLNPRKVFSCFADESFLGYLKRIGTRCHASTMTKRIFERYLMFLALRWRDARLGANGGDH